MTQMCTRRGGTWRRAGPNLGRRGSEVRKKETERGEETGLYKALGVDHE